MSDSATPRTVALQAPLSVGFSRQEFWSGLPRPSSRGSSRLRDPTRISMSPALAVAFFTASATWEARGQSRKTRHRQVVMALCLPLQHQLLLSDPNAPHVSSPFWALSWPAPSVGCSSLFPILLIWKKPVYGPDFTALCSLVSSPWKSFPSHPF